MAVFNEQSLLVVERKDGNSLRQWQLTASGQLLPSAVSKTQHEVFRGLELEQQLTSAFLPVGYPDSVTADYKGYVVWHTVQAISSYVRGVLSSHAVFKGVGVGSQAATALGAVFQFFVRDILGMAGGILFAYAAGGNFDSHAKQWRLFADVMNDVAMALDLASPLLPGSCFMLLVSLASVARAMVGMAAGATHAALTQHFAAAGSNAADISAKAESRERAASIIGSLLGMWFTQHVAENVVAAWLFFAVLTVFHVWANIRAMRQLVLSSVNEPRLRLLLTHYQDKDKVLSPKQVASLENLAVPPLANFIMRSSSPHQIRAVVGAQLHSVLSRTAASGASDKSYTSGQLLQEVLKSQPAAHDRKYMLFLNGGKKQSIEVVLHSDAEHQDLLQAHIHMLYLTNQLQQVVDSRSSAQQLLHNSQHWMERQAPAFLAALKQHGWELDKIYLPKPRYTAYW